jgi:sulfotransferase
MIRCIHAISGLPRSGSTLLAALLRQNPAFVAGMTTPMFMLVNTFLDQVSPGREFSNFFDEDRRVSMLRSMFDGYYGAAASGKIVFDTNRSWPPRSAILQRIYPTSRIICCVRDVGWILDSFERVLRESPLHVSRIFLPKPATNVYSRAQYLLNPETGLVGLAWHAMREAWFGPDASRLIVVRYDSLVANPKAAMDRLYDFLGEPRFEHDFGNVVYDQADYDDELGLPGMHRVRARVEPNRRSPGIPPELFSQFSGMSFWSQSSENPNGVIVL